MQFKLFRPTNKTHSTDKGDRRAETQVKVKTKEISRNVINSMDKN